MKFSILHQLVRPVTSLVIAWAFTHSNAIAQPTVARTWDEQILAAIRIDKPNPPVHARNLFHLSAAMYDAWAAYDTVAVGYIHHERQTAANTVAARREAISYAAYRILKIRYANSANATITAASLDNQMINLGYDSSITNVVGNSPSALGNRIATTIMTWGNSDGSNQPGGYVDATYNNSQPAMMVLQAGAPLGGIPSGTNPTRWQRLSFDGALTQNGLTADMVQKFVGVTWLKTYPFSLERAGSTVPWIDTGGPSKLNTASDTACKQDILEMLRAGSQLNSQQVIDISPGTGGLGNNLLGTDNGNGQAMNPVSGLPYATNLTKIGDFSRVLAEFWADGPSSETPPGHWQVIANQVADNPLTQKRIGGVGPIVDDLEWDVKTYFALSASTHDAACAAWSLKRYYEGVRPITLIRYMASKGQSSYPSGPSYHVEGLPLESGVVEVITTTTAMPGGRHEGVGAVGDVVVFSWPGEPADITTQQSLLRWNKGIDWVPYQRKTFNTPAFPGYVSGHSTFSRAAAEVLTSLTGSAYFPGGMGHFTAPANSYLFFERGPSQTVDLQWATYYDAADQAGQSRRWGGIHVVEDDFTGRIIGSECGKRAWKLAMKYFDGTAATEVSNTNIFFISATQLKLEWTGKRGMYYGVESSTDLINWIPSTITRATDTRGSKILTASGGKQFYRVSQNLNP